MKLRAIQHAVRKRKSAQFCVDVSKLRVSYRGDKAMSEIVRWEFSQLDAKNHERLRKAEAEVTGRIRDVSESQESNDRNNKVSKSCHDLRTVACSHSRMIFVKCYIAHIVHSVFNFPMSSIKFQQPLR